MLPSMAPIQPWPPYARLAGLITLQGFTCAAYPSHVIRQLWRQKRQQELEYSLHREYLVAGSGSR